MAKIFWGGLSVILLFACNDFSGESNKNSRINSLYTNSSRLNNLNLQSNIYDNVLLSNVISDYHFIKLQINEEAIIGSIDKVVAENNRFYILDSRISKGLFVFDSLGKHLFSLNKIGTGPGEISHPQDFCINDTSIIILDNWRKLVIFDKNTGRYRTQILLPFNANNINFLNASENILTIFNGHSIEKSNYDFDLLSLDLTKNKILTRDLSKSSFSSIRFTSRFHLFKSSKDLYCLQNFNDTIYRIDDSGLSPAFYLNFNKKQMPESFKKGLVGKEGQLLPNIIVSSPYVHSPSNLVFSRNYLFLTYAYNKSIYKTFVNRMTGDVAEIKTYIDDLFFGSLNFLPVGSAGENYFIFYLEPNTIVNAFDTNTKLKQTEIFNKLGDLKRDDNPVLVIASIALKKS